MRRMLAGLALLVAGSVIAAAGGSRSLTPQDEFGNWPEGTAPQEIGKRVAANFAARPLERPTGFVIYPEVCAWYGSLTVAVLT